tara:strand:+ start:2001 stop:3113 length:1113 start_codon:yes stop_codon:yes gene_type:complete
MKKGILALTILLITIESVMAQAVSRLGVTLWAWLTTPGIVFFFTILFLFTLFLAIFTIALQKVPIFEEKPRQAIIAALAISLLTVIPLVFFGRDFGIVAFLTRYLAPFGFFAMVALALLMFGLIYWGARDDHHHHSWQIAMFGAGLSLIFFGLIAQNPTAVAWGTVFAVIGGIAFLASGGGHGDGFHMPWGHGGHGGHHGGGHRGGHHGGGHHGGGHGGNDHVDHGPHQAPPRPEPRRGQQGNVPDYRNDLARIQQLNNQYITAYTTYTGIGDQILTINHQNNQNPGAPQQPLPWQNYRQQLQGLNTQAAQLNNAFRAIANHNHFRNIAPNQRAFYQQQLGAWNQNLQTMQNYRNDFIHRFQNNQGPRGG